jgi:hypothetical protein
MKIITLLIIIQALFMVSCNRSNNIVIKDDIYEDREHFRIETKTATYVFDKAGGGLSRVIDRNGIDWVHYNGDPHAKVPSGASGGYRGIPNMVFRGDDGGAGHPGFDQCISEIVDERTIRSTSKSGKWQWSWTFFDDHARMVVEKADPERTYWFLYEGPVAGSFNPYNKYWGTDLGGPRYETPSLNKGENIVGNWQWVYFGDKDTDRSFFVAQKPADELNDFFSYMGNTSDGNDAPDGMIVFGFGRDKGTVSLLKGPGITFVIGFLERKIATNDDHRWAAQKINDIMNRE